MVLPACNASEFSAVQFSAVWGWPAGVGTDRRFCQTLSFPEVTESISLHCTALNYTALHCTALHYTELHSTTLNYTALHWTTQHYTALHSITLQCQALQCTTMNCSWLCAQLGSFKNYLKFIGINFFMFLWSGMLLNMFWKLSKFI